MKSIIQKSLYILFLANFLCNTSCFAGQHKSLKKKKRVDKKYFLLVPASIVISFAFMLFKKYNDPNNGGDSQDSQEQPNNNGANVDPLKEKDALLLYKNAIEGNTQAVTDLLEKGADINLKHGLKKKTALHVACQYGYKDIVEILLKKKGADINAKDSLQRTPLHLAYKYGHKNIVKILLDNGATIKEDVNRSYTQLVTKLKEIDKSN